MSTTKTVAVSLLEDVLQALAAPFAPEKIRTRPGPGNRTFRYIEWKDATERLDAVAPGWHYTIKAVDAIGDSLYVIATITVMGVVREGIGQRKLADIDAVKGAESDALKRAATKFGIARDLYSDDENHSAAPSGSRAEFEKHVASSYQQPPRDVQAPPEPPREFKSISIADAKSDAIAKDITDLASPKQLAAIRAIANANGVDAEKECRRLLGCDTAELSRKAASALIDNMKNQQTAR